MRGDSSTYDGWRRLQAFLAGGYADEELRMLAEGAFADVCIARSVPGAGASVQELSWAIVDLVRKNFRAPPASLWAYLKETRPHRDAEIMANEGMFAVEVEVSSAQARTTAGWRADITLVEGPRGACDLLDVLAEERVRAAGARVLPEFLELLVAGMVNGLARTVGLTWTERVLVLRATPCVYRDGEGLPNRVELRTPVDGAEFRYFPGGIHCYRAGRPPPEVTLRVEVWGERSRRLVLTDATGLQRLSIEFLSAARGGGR